jgi:hypothetical protein
MDADRSHQLHDLGRPLPSVRTELALDVLRLLYHSQALKAAGIVVYDLRMTAGAWGEPPVQWETLRTFVRVSAADDSEARGDVAGALGIEASDLVAYSNEFFG